MSGEICLINIEELIQKGESATLEFKKSTALLPKIGETLCGFLNGSGGKVLKGFQMDFGESGGNRRKSA